MPEDILCLNAGSSSLKFALYRMDDTKEELLTSGTIRADATGASSEFGAAVRQVVADLEKRGLATPAAAGHRLVHGGPPEAAPRRNDAGLLGRPRGGVPPPPPHLPSEVAGLEGGTP